MVRFVSVIATDPSLRGSKPSRMAVPVSHFMNPRPPSRRARPLSSIEAAVSWAADGSPEFQLCWARRYHSDNPQNRPLDPCVPDLDLVAIDDAIRPLKKGTGSEQSHRSDREFACREVPVSLFQYAATRERWARHSSHLPGDGRVQRIGGWVVAAGGTIRATIDTPLIPSIAEDYRVSSGNSRPSESHRNIRRDRERADLSNRECRQDGKVCGM